MTFSQADIKAAIGASLQSTTTSSTTSSREQADIDAAKLASLQTNASSKQSACDGDKKLSACDFVNLTGDSDDDDEIQPPSHRRGKRDRSFKSLDTYDETEKKKKKMMIPTPKVPNVVILGDTDDESEKEEKLAPAAAKKKAKVTNTILGEPLSEEEAIVRANECLSQSVQANTTSNGPSLRPGFHKNPVLSKLLPSNHECFTNSPKSENLAKKLLKDGDILAFNLHLIRPAFKSCAALYLCLMTLLLQGRLIVNYFLRGCGSSGVNPQRCRDVLVTIPDFKMLIEMLESAFGQFGRLWVAANRSGKQKKHGDKLRKGCTHRALQSYLCIDKIMWYECQETGVTFGLLVPHGAFLILSSRGGGFDGKIYHSVDGGEHSWLLAFDFSYKNIKQD